MFETLSPLVGSLIVIVLVWITALIIGLIAKVSVLKSLGSAGKETKTGDTPDADLQKTVDRRIKIRKGFKIYNIAVSAIAAVSFLIFVLFMNNLGAKSEADTAKIDTAPLPENFQPPTEKEIEKSNEQAVTNKADEVKQEAIEDNTKAMNEAINTFKKAK